MLKSLSRSLPSFSKDPSSALTPPPLPIESLEQVTTRKEVVVGLLATLDHFLRQATKSKADPRGGGSSSNVALPVVWLGEEMSRQGEALGALPATEDGRPDAVPTLGELLQVAGETQVRLGRLQVAMTDATSLGFLASLEDLEAQHKALDKALKDAEKRRSALESRLAKKGENDEDRTTEMEYSDACDALARLVVSLDATVDAQIAGLEDFIDAQLEYATKSAAILTECKAAFSGRAKLSKPTSLAIPRTVTRMTRSQSDSAARPPSFASSSRPVPAPPTRSAQGSRRSTISQGSADATPASAVPDTVKQTTRSRSASLLGRFTTTGRKEKEREKRERQRSKAEDATDDDDDDDNARASEDGDDSDHTGPVTTATSPSPSRFNTALPSLDSFKKLGMSSKYDSLGDDSIIRTGPKPLPPSFSNTSFGAPPKLKRTQTAPPAPTRTVGKTFEAKWRFAGSDGEELSFEKGDVVEVIEEVNAEWWIGKLISPASGKKGMFPSAYVVPLLEQEPATTLWRVESATTDEGDNYSIDEKSGLQAGNGRFTSDHDDDDDDHVFTRTLSSFKSTALSSPGRKAPPPPPRRQTNQGTSPFED